MSKKTKSEPVERLEEAAWMGTLADLVFLLITFFVLLISMSSLNAKKLEEAFGMFDNAVDVLNFPKDGGGSDRFVNLVTPVADIMPIDGVDEAPPEDATGASKKAAKKLLKHLAQAISDSQPPTGLIGTLKSLAEQAGGVFKIEKVDNGLAVVLPGRILFPGTTTEIDEEGRVLLEDIATILKLWGGNIDVIAYWSWHDGPSILGQIIEVLEKNWVRGELIHPTIHPITKRTIRFVMRSGEE